MGWIVSPSCLEIGISGTALACIIPLFPGTANSGAIPIGRRRRKTRLARDPAQGRTSAFIKFDSEHVVIC